MDNSAGSYILINFDSSEDAEHAKDSFTASPWHATTANWYSREKYGVVCGFEDFARRFDASSCVWGFPEEHRPTRFSYQDGHPSAISPTHAALVSGKTVPERPKKQRRRRRGNQKKLLREE